MDRSEIKLVADCHEATTALSVATEVNLVIALRFYSMTNSIESLERLERAHELVTALSVEVSSVYLQTTEIWKLASSSLQ